jgi:type IV secretion system protein VirD4
MDQLHGSAHWAAPEDVKRSGLLGNTDGVCVGAWESTARRWLLPLWCFPQKKTLYLRHNGEGHVLCFAPTGAGKTTSLVVPTLVSWSGSVVVYDLKGENYKLTAGYRAECGHVVFRFAPLDPINSNRFNPLEHYPFGNYIVQPGEIWVASSWNYKSFDSRYFGPVRLNTIRHYLQPVYVWGNPDE